MNEPVFLTVDQVLRLHSRSIAAFGGTDGLREPALFEGAVLHPRNVYHYAQGGFVRDAAAYAFHLAQAQAFLDGNKRTGMGAALVFLEANGIRIPENTERLHAAMIDMACREIDKAGLAALFRELVAK